MGKRLSATLASLVLLLSLAGCTTDLPTEVSSSPQSSPALISSPTPSPTLPSTPTPTRTPIQEPVLQWSFDPYALSSDVKTYLGEKLQDYRLLVNAVLQRQDTVTLAKESVIPSLSCLYAEFPLSVLLQDYAVDKKGTTVTLEFIYDQEDHAARVQAFKQRVESVIRAEIKTGYNECERALALYRWTAQNINYLDGDNVTPYHALMDGVGICQSYEGVYQYLLLQVGIDALSGGAFMTDEAAHAWTLVSLNGVWYHMDPTFESAQTMGAGLWYFGMDDARRLESGVVQPITTGVDDWCIRAPACEDTAFAALASCLAWEFDETAHRILIYERNGTKPFAVFDTVTCEWIDL